MMPVRSCYRARATDGVSRRAFLGATAAGLALAVVPAAGSPPASVFAQGGSRGESPAGTFTRPWLQRNYGSGLAAVHPVCWHCDSTGALLELDAEGVWLHEPGWGGRRFAFAAFREGYPQEAIRRVFGYSVAEELERSVEALFSLMRAGTRS
jgi:hypothetical protein